MTNEQAQELVRSLFAMYPRFKSKEETVDVYAASITRYEAGLVARAFTQLSEEEEYVPSIRTIHNKIRELHPKSENDRYTVVMATRAERKCRICNGLGWVDAEPHERDNLEYTAVRPCPCRGGDPTTIQEIDRNTLPDEVLAAICELETLLDHPLSQEALKIVASDLSSPHPEQATTRIQTAVRLLKASQESDQETPPCQDTSVSKPASSSIESSINS